MAKNKFMLTLGALSTAVFLSSCGNDYLAALEKEPRDEREFHNALANEYEALAKKEINIYGDGTDGDRFAIKGLRAADGLQVLPESPDQWGFKGHMLNFLLDARHRLMFVLGNKGRSIEPELGAKTQVAYDCLVEELEEGSDLHDAQAKEINVCKKLFISRLGDLETAVFRHGPVRRVMFDYNSYNIEHDGMMTIKEVAMRIKRFGDRRVMIVGHTDPVGKMSTNKVLSQHRAKIVKEALVRLGVPADRITTFQGRGELKTSPREFEPNNRSADIYFY